MSGDGRKNEARRGTQREEGSYSRHEMEKDVRCLSSELGGVLGLSDILCREDVLLLEEISLPLLELSEVSVDVVRETLLLDMLVSGDFVELGLKVSSVGLAVKEKRKKVSERIRSKGRKKERERT